MQALLAFGEAMPYGQSWQDDDPSASLYVPGGQGVHGPASAPVYPASQMQIVWAVL